jgi:hypothetical protein
MQFTFATVSYQKLEPKNSFREKLQVLENWGFLALTFEIR